MVVLASPRPVEHKPMKKQGRRCARQPAGEWRPLRSTVVLCAGGGELPTQRTYSRNLVYVYVCMYVYIYINHNLGV